MSFSQPDLSELLSNEQLLNTNLLSLRTELRNKLTLLNIGYSNSDTILQLIAKAKPNYYWMARNDLSIGKMYVTTPVAITNCSSTGSWGYGGNGVYPRSTATETGSATVVGLCEYVQHGDVYGTDEFLMKIYNGITSDMTSAGTGVYSGTGFSIGLPSSSGINGVYFGVSIESNNVIYPCILKYNNSTTPTKTLVTDGGAITDSSFSMKIKNDTEYDELSVRWYDANGNFIWNGFVEYSEFTTASAMEGTIIFGILGGATSVTSSNVVPALSMIAGSYIDK